jgi:ATP-binding cassette subfamily C (CFTR/MRP) protein 5
MVNVDRCIKMLDIPQEHMRGTKAMRDFFDEREDWPERGRIVFDKVNLRYRPNTEVILRDLTFEVKPREKIGVVGRTGAGKSTICLSLSRIVEIASGTIKIDGVNIADLPLNELRYRITVIPQVRRKRANNL